MISFELVASCNMMLTLRIKIMESFSNDIPVVLNVIIKLPSIQARLTDSGKLILQCTDQEGSEIPEVGNSCDAKCHGDSLNDECLSHR